MEVAALLVLGAGDDEASWAGDDVVVSFSVVDSRRGSEDCRDDVGGTDVEVEDRVGVWFPMPWMKFWKKFNSSDELDTGAASAVDTDAMSTMANEWRMEYFMFERRTVVGGGESGGNGEVFPESRASSGQPHQLDKTK